MARDARDPTDFKPVEYWLGCVTRMSEAERFLMSEDFGSVLVHAGIAAECAIRSLFAPGTAFDKRHDLRALLSGASDRPSKTLVAATESLRALWRNSFRYMGPDQQARVLRSTGRFASRTNQQILKEAAATAMEAAGVIVSRAARVHGRENPG